MGQSVRWCSFYQPLPKLVPLCKVAPQMHMRRQQLQKHARNQCCMNLDAIQELLHPGAMTISHSLNDDSAGYGDIGM